MYKKNSAEEIRRFIDKLAKFLNEQIGKSIYILANDANIGMKYEGGRDFFKEKYDLLIRAPVLKY